MENNGWIEKEHPVFGDHGHEPAKETEKLLGREGIFPRTQWTKGLWSIIPPCEVTFGQYELYPVEGDIMRFDSLEEAQAYADSHEAKPRKEEGGEESTDA